MTHDQIRDLIGADPESPPPVVQAHVASCPECRAYQEQMLAFNAKLRRALELDWTKVDPTAAARPSGATFADTPSSTPATVLADDEPTIDQSKVVHLQRPDSASPPAPKLKQPKLFALAASVIAATVLGFTFWLARPQESLAAEVVGHVEGEPNSWNETQPITGEKLENLLRKTGVKLGSGMQPVVYASSCWFRGHFVPHMVVTTPQGPVTIMILSNETVPAAERFNEDGFTGMLVPAPKGSVAVLSRTPMELDQAASTVVHALQSAN